MKTTLLTTGIIAAGIGIILIPANAQVIPNYNFETWSNGANNAPDSWRDHGSNNPGFYPVIQTSDRYLGSYAVRMENKITSTDTTQGRISTIRPGNKEGFGPAFQISARHNSLKGFYKYAPANGDSAEIIVYITKTGYVNNDGWGNLLAWGQKHLGASATYIPFSVGYLDSLTTFYYDSPTLLPDSAYIDIAAYVSVGLTPGNEPKPKGNSVLYVDALNFDTYLTDINEHLDITTNFNLFPNSSNGNFDVIFETSENDYITIKTYDLDGREILNLHSGNLGAGNHIFHYNMAELSSGNYFYVVASQKGYRAEKFTIKK